MAVQFDEISPVYDETRDPLEPATVDRLSQALTTAGASTLLEIGVGTGRVARPLLDRGVLVTGIDASRGMLARARSKQIPRLVRGSGYRLPFADQTFDATLFVHVLHVLDDPEAAVREAMRVSRVGAFALVRPRDPAGVPATRGEDEARGMLREILAEQGYPLPPRSSPHTKERDFLSRFPPSALTIVNERDVTEPLRARIDRMEKRGQRHLLTIPPEALQRAVAIARARCGDRTVTYHRVQALAQWIPGEPPAGATA
ncbi:MAG: class I SAM-dependent methyltransferase [Thermoplasmata archaeon]